MAVASDLHNIFVLLHCNTFSCLLFSLWHYYYQRLYLTLLTLIFCFYFLFLMVFYVHLAYHQHYKAWYFCNILRIKFVCIYTRTRGCWKVCGLAHKISVSMIKHQKSDFKKWVGLKTFQRPFGCVVVYMW